MIILSPVTDSWSQLQCLNQRKWGNGRRHYLNRFMTKTTKMACAPSEDSDQPGHPPSLIRVFAVGMKKAWALSYPLSAQQRLWSDWVDAHADLSSLGCTVILMVLLWGGSFHDQSPRKLAGARTRDPCGSAVRHAADRTSEPSTTEVVTVKYG